VQPPIALCFCGLALLALTACGSTSHVSVTVLSPDQEPVPHAVVTVAATHITATTDDQGSARLSGFRPGTYALTASAPGYYDTTAKRRLSPGASVALELEYRLPLGTYVWNIGPAGEFWDVATITRSAVTATEYDWTCRRDPVTRKEVGHWVTFAGASPYAVAPDTIAPEWVRRSFAGGLPPRPRSGCATS